MEQYNSPYPDYPSSGKSALAAGLLALFLGGLGIHKFYMRKPGMGVLYLLFFWTGIPALVGFVEGLMYLFDSRERFERRIPR